jgi:glycosyltransferase involved in cell wall biosynthesis
MPYSEPEPVIVFYFPSHDVGGVPVLFLRIARLLSRNRKVMIADYSDGYMARRLPPDVELLPIDSGISFPKGCIVVFQSFLPWRFPFFDKVTPDSKALFWSLHPDNFDPTIFNYRSGPLWSRKFATLANHLAFDRKRKIVRLINFLIDHHALSVMDRENWRRIQEIREDSNMSAAEYLPVPTDTPSFHRAGPVTDSVNSFVWVGRLADFKYRILEHTMIRLAAESLTYGPIKFSIVGNGPYAKYLENIAARLSGPTFSVQFVGEFESNELERYLYGNADVVFAMGTSALEAAAMGIPVFLTDFSFAPVKGLYRYRYFYQTLGYSLGEEINSSHLESESTLEQLLMDLRTNYALHAERCSMFHREHFCLESVMTRFVDRLAGTEASFGQMSDLGFFKPDIIGGTLRGIAWRVLGRMDGKPVGFRGDC